MSDDIVTMLRKEYDHFNNDGVGDYELLTIAADEIERLREQIKTVNLEWRDLIDQTQEKAFAEIERLRTEVDKWKKIARERNPRSWVNLVRKKYGIEDMYER